MAFKGNSYMSGDDFKKAVKMYVEELVNNGWHSHEATDLMKGPEVNTINDLKKLNQDDFFKVNNMFIGAQQVAWMIYNGEIKVNNYKKPSIFD